MVVPVGNENARHIQSKDLSMECQLFAANPERGRGRNYIGIFGFALNYTGVFCKLLLFHDICVFLSVILI